ncbi:RNF41 ligase, partial [Polyodon spathula]|nr:RNF41 ligase [Polyodon spathula]
MGYDIERFVGYVNDGLLCCICRDVLENPLQAPCEHAYCTSCIQGWLVHHHNCPEDRQALDLSMLRPLFRSEMICKVEEVRHEMESRLDSQRRHMVQKESLLKNEIEELKSQMSRVMSDVRTLLAAERLHRQDLEQAELEKRELVELLKSLQRDGYAGSNIAEGSIRKSSGSRTLARLDSIKRKPREVTVI